MAEFKKNKPQEVARAAEVAKKQGARNPSGAHDHNEQFNCRFSFSVQRRFARFLADRNLKKGETVERALSEFMDKNSFTG